MRPEELLLLRPARIHCTLGQWKEFKEQSLLWRDMQATLKALFDESALAYDNAKEIGDFREVQGIRQAIQYMMALPDLIIEGLEREDDTSELG